MNVRTSAPATLALLLFAAPAAAQDWAVDRGSLRLGGSAAFTSTGNSVNGNDADDRATQISIAPFLQYFVAPGLALGGEVGISHLSAGDNDLTSYGIGPAANYYFGASAPRSMWPFIGAGLQFVWTSTDSDLGEDPTTRVLQGEAGLLFMVADAVGIETALFYQTQEREAGDFEAESDTFGLSVGISAFVF